MAEIASQALPFVTTVIASTVSSSSMFSKTPKSHLYGGSFIPLGYQALNGTYYGVSSSPWTSPMSSSGILSGFSLTGIE